MEAASKKPRALRGALGRPPPRRPHGRARQPHRLSGPPVQSGLDPVGAVQTWTNGGGERRSLSVRCRQRQSPENRLFRAISGASREVAHRDSNPCYRRESEPGSAVLQARNEPTEKLGPNLDQSGRLRRALLRSYKDVRHQRKRVRPIDDLWQRSEGRDGGQRRGRLVSPSHEVLVLVAAWPSQAGHASINHSRMAQRAESNVRSGL